MSARAQRNVAARPAIAQRRSSESLQRFLDDSLEHEHIRFFSGLLVGLGVSALLWAALAAIGYGMYLLITV